MNYNKINYCILRIGLVDGTNYVLIKHDVYTIKKFTKFKCISKYNSLYIKFWLGIRYDC